MTARSVDVTTSADGTLIIRPAGRLVPGDPAELRRALVHALRHVRPRRLAVDLHHLPDLDPIELGTLAAAFQLGEDHHVAIFIDRSTEAVADRLIAAGVPPHRLRHVGEAIAA